MRLDFNLRAVAGIYHAIRLSGRVGAALPVCVEVSRRAAHDSGHIISFRYGHRGVDAFHQAAVGGSAARSGNQLQRAESCGVSFVVYDATPRLAFARAASVALRVGDYLGG